MCRASLYSVCEFTLPSSLQVGDNALFISDQYGNYLALTVDEKTYYLNHTSTAQLEDLVLKNQRLNFRRYVVK